MEKNEFITWNDLSVGLWAGIVFLGVLAVKFISWVSVREINSFWEKIDKLQTTKINDLKSEIDNKFNALDEKVSKIQKATHGKREAQDSVMLLVLEELKKLEEKSDLITKVKK